MCCAPLPLVPRTFVFGKVTLLRSNVTLMLRSSYIENANMLPGCHLYVLSATIRLAISSNASPYENIDQMMSPTKLNNARR
jgi:hypothetical protein